MATESFLSSSAARPSASVAPASCPEVVVVLLCKGRGGDPNTYRPNRDETQYVARRDALVRCVASFLFGPSKYERLEGKNAMGNMTSASSREMIMLFDEDMAELHMALDNAIAFPSSTPKRELNRNSQGENYTTEFDRGKQRMQVIPTEKTILLLWKRAALKLNETVRLNGMVCRISIDPSRKLAMLSAPPSTSTFSSQSLPPGLDSKRQVLQYLQKHCTMEYLRSKGLNSSADVILRKTNKKKLMDILNDWSKNSKSKGSSPSAGTDSSDDSKLKQMEAIESIYSEILTRRDKLNVGSIMTVAGILHETCPEFPCFGQELPSNLNGFPPHSIGYRLFLFLGAVRDMTEMENKVLYRVCERHQIPRIGVRFGTVPEFTSKILSILAFHHAHDKLNGAVRRLLSERNISMNKPTTSIEDSSVDTTWSSTSKTYRTSLNVVCAVPMPSTKLSTNLSNRDRIHWCLVRVIVCTLWRSRLASASTSATANTTNANHSNSLCLIFSDNVYVHLGEKDFVQKLAERHQAAPSEFQVLNALKEEMEMNSKCGPQKSKRLAKAIIDALVDKCSSHVTGIVSFGANDRYSSTTKYAGFIANQFYSNKKCNEQSTNCIISVICINSDSGKAKSSSSMEKHENSNDYGLMQKKIVKSFISISAKRRFPVVHEMMPMCEDREAASIVAIQHFCYQNRLFVGNISSNSGNMSGTKRKLKSN